MKEASLSESWQQIEYCSIVYSCFRLFVEHVLRISRKVLVIYRLFASGSGITNPQYTNWLPLPITSSPSNTLIL